MKLMVIFSLILMISNLSLADGGAIVAHNAAEIAANLEQYNCRYAIDWYEYRSDCTAEKINTNCKVGSQVDNMKVNVPKGSSNEVVRANFINIKGFQYVNSMPPTLNSPAFIKFVGESRNFHHLLWIECKLDSK